MNTPDQDAHSINDQDGSDDANKIVDEDANENNEAEVIIDDKEHDTDDHVFPENDIMEYPLVANNEDDDCKKWTAFNVEGTDVSIHYHRTLRVNQDFADNDLFWENSRFALSRCELGILRDINNGTNKAGKLKSKGTWYACRLRAMGTAVDHTRQGIKTRNYYAKKASAKAEKTKGKKK